MNNDYINIVSFCFSRFIIFILTIEKFIKLLTNINLKIF